jgi:carboxynorspermidine decarboxylase
VIDERRLKENGEILKGVQERTGCKILLAQKAFSNFNVYPLLRQYLAGTEASGLYEARLGAEEMPGKECHVFCGAYRQEELPELLNYADHIVFNSIHQLKKYGKMVKQAGGSIGLRINPECSTQEGHAIYDPCAPGSRLGTTRAQWDAQMDESLLELLDGLHFHTLCEQNAGDLALTLQAVEQRFGEFLPRMKWLNMGGGHHITRSDYDIALLEQCICTMRDRYQVQVYLEPGEAVALNAGYLVTEVLDTGKNGAIRFAILDMSAACHTPDVIEMPYRPPLRDAGEPGEYEFTFRLGGPTCLAGDVIGDYSFPDRLQEGDRLIFEDMAIYTMCKNNTFNGMPLPCIYLLQEDGSIRLLAEFGYEDFKGRLGK